MYKRQHEKARELTARYRMTSQDLHRHTGEVGASVNSILRRDFVRRADVPRPTFTDAGVGTQRFVRASSAAPAISTASSSSATQVAAAAPAPRAARTQVRQVPRNVQEMRDLCSTFNNKKLADLIKSAIKPGSGDRSFLSHTDRFRNDLGYRTRCRQANPPVPEWLVFPDFRIAKAHGGTGDQGFENCEWEFEIA